MTPTPTRLSMTNLRYIVMDAAAKMPLKCWGKYRRVAVLEVDCAGLPSMISDRARGVVRVVRTWEKLNVGSTDRCAFEVALAEAYALAAKLTAAYATPAILLPVSA